MTVILRTLDKCDEGLQALIEPGLRSLEAERNIPSSGKRSRRNLSSRWSANRDLGARFHNGISVLTATEVAARPLTPSC